MNRLNYKEYGSGEPIIILHGLLGMLDNWHTFAKALAQNYWVISIDQRNHGRSFHSTEFDYKLLAEDLKDFMEEQHIPRAVLLGHSMGGKTVMQFLTQHEEMVSKAIIVDIAPDGTTGTHKPIFDALRSVNVESVANRKEVQESLMKEIGTLSTVQFLMKNLTLNKETGTYQWKANLDALWENYDNIMSPIQSDYPCETDTLFIAGEKSNYIKESDLESITKLFPNHKMETISDAGHWIHAEQPKRLLEVVEGFVKT